ncbi:MAG TPA: HEAT repeat domain-containing protein [Myxococcaceae bacterium]|nr:HEAT repeat domain-containing protein [Myxococcaceae bacterium]
MGRRKEIDVGFLDMFGGGTPAEKAQKLKAKVTQKYGDPLVRQKAIQQVAQLRVPEAVTVLMSRFTFTVEPQTTDSDEKEQTFQHICDLGKGAVAPVTEFLRKSEHASSWALRVLASTLAEGEVIGTVTDELSRLGSAYTRDPEKKVVLLGFLSGKSDERIAKVALPFLEDHSDDVKIAALKLLGPLQHEPAREPMLRLLTGEETARRVQTNAMEALFESQFGVQGFREKVEALAKDPYFVDKGGLIKKRG